MGDIYCQIAETTIPPELCAAEQDGVACAGCSAETRRCTACGVAQGIADAKRGLCAPCVEVVLGALVDAQGSERAPHVDRSMLVRIAARIRSTAPTIAPGAEPSESKWGSQTMRPLTLPSVLRDHDRVVAILAEHATLRGETCVVPAAAVTLAARVHSTPEETERTLRDLAASGRITRDGEGIRIVGLDAPPTHEAEIDDEDTDVVRRTRYASAFARHIGTQPTSDATSAGSLVADTEHRRVVLRPRERQEPIAKTFAAIYADLVARAATINGERIVRGAVPMLQLALRIGPRDAVEVLERLATDGHLAPRDGWRTVVLSAEHITDDRIAYTPPPLSHGTAAGARPPLIVLPDAFSENVRALVGHVRSETTDPEALDAAVQLLEEWRPRLHELRDAVLRRIDELDAALTLFRSTRSSHRGSEADVASAPEGRNPPPT